MHAELRKMPKVRTNRTVYPEGWELIEPTLRDLETKMREGMSAVPDSSLSHFECLPFFLASSLACGNPN